MKKLVFVVILFLISSTSFSQQETKSVVVELITNEDGQVTNVNLVKSSNNKELDEKAIQIGKNKKFVPTIIDGQKVKIKTNLSLSFDSSNNKNLKQNNLDDDYFVSLMNLKIKSGPNPDLFYPSFSKRIGEQGVVIAEVFVDEDGKASNIEITKTSGFARLDKATISYLKEVTFDVPIINNKAVKVLGPYVMRFTLTKN